MWLRELIGVLEKILARIMPVMHSIGAYLIVAMMLITVVSVFGRRFFDAPIPGAYELTEFMMVIVVFFAIANCEFTRGHITIDILVNRFGKKNQAITNSIMYFLTLSAVVILTWRLFIDGATENHITAVLSINIFPFIYIAALGSACLSLIVLMHFLEFIVEVLKK